MHWAGWGWREVIRAACAFQTQVQKEQMSHPKEGQC